MTKVFISYRRNDCPFVAHLIYERLLHAMKPDHLNQVFLDVDHHDASQPFPDKLSQHLNECRVVLVVIGENWLTACDEAGRRRLDDPKDYVRIEVEHALEAGERIAVIPVLVGSTSMPKQNDLPKKLGPLSHRDKMQLVAGSDLGAQLDGLTKLVQQNVDGITEIPFYGIELKRVDRIGRPVCRPFNMSIYPITQELYCRVMDVDNPSRFSDEDDVDMRRPVECVTWLRALAFCNKLSRQEGIKRYYDIKGQEVLIQDFNGPGYRLPTREEWESAAIGPSGAFPTDWADNLSCYAWYGKNAEGTTQPVGKLEPNGFGLFDMFGNVWEWCWDSAIEDAKKREVRGGCFNSPQSEVIRMFVKDYSLNASSQFVGFRLASNA